MAGPWNVGRAVADWLITIEIAVADLDIETTIGVGASPSLEVNGCPLPSEVRKGHQLTVAATSALRKVRLHLILLSPGHIPYTPIKEAA